MRKSEKLRKEADALKYYADTLMSNRELHRDIVRRTDFATNLLLDNKVTPEAIEKYRARIHRINLDLQAITRHEQCASAQLRAELKEIDAQWNETNE